MTIEIREWNGDWRYEVENDEDAIIASGICHTLDECYEKITQIVNDEREAQS